MTLVYILVCCVPFLIIILTFLLIGATASRFYRAGRSVYIDMSPSIEKLKNSVDAVQSKSTSISDRSQNISKAYEEISGRWAFVQEAYEEIMDNPAVKFAGMASRFTGRK